MSNLAVCLSYLVAHGVIYVVSVPLANRRVKPNALYGFRTPKTLSSDRIWYSANAFAGRALMKSSIVASVLLVLGLILVRGPMYLGWATLSTLACVGAAIGVSAIRLRSL